MNLCPIESFSSALFSSLSIAIRRSLMCLVLILAQNFHVEPVQYFLTRAVYGIPVFCSPWTVRPDQDFDKCMGSQRSIDIAYGLTSDS
jgi:hypothetical protein